MSQTLWSSLAASAATSLDAEQHQRMARYLDLLLEANRSINLTRITDRAAAEVQHIGDSLTLLPFLPRGSFALVDVGSGGGVPGIPLAIARPDAQVTLIESTKKKAVCLEKFAAEVGLANISVRAIRSEEAGRSLRR